MFARVHFMNTETGKRDEVTKFIRETVLPSARDWQGFKGYLALLEPNTGKWIAIALWETEEDVSASAPSNQELVAKSMEFLTAAPVSEVYEVVLQEM